MHFLFTILTVLLKPPSNASTNPPNDTLSEESTQNDSLQYEMNSYEKLFDSFIVGGQYATIKDFPHSAFLVIQCSKKVYEEFTCGASILNQLILLTAAHCFEECQTGTRILVSVGNRIKTKGTFYTVGKFANHGEYNGRIMKNDIALAVLTQPLVFSSSVKRVVLARFAMSDVNALLAGWGVTNVIFSFFLNANELSHYKLY